MLRFGIGLFVLNFPLILSLPAGDVFAIDPGLSSAWDTQPCNFNGDRRTYNATDLLLCLSNLASNVPQQRTNPNKITDRMMIDEARQLLPSYPYAPDFSSNYLNENTITSFLSGLLPNGIPNLSNLLNFNGLTRPNFNLFNALNSIAQYDDLKCVPRILCEVASGSAPGSLNYRQSPGNTFQSFGQDALFGLLTAFDSRGTSPLISFGKAALLGYANRGHSSMCYREYSRCPSNSDQLISYLNNHNGGFFQLFNGNKGSYYKPQQSHYQQSYYQQPYYKQAGDAEYRIVGSKTNYAAAQPYLGPEADRTGTGKLSFSNSEYYGQDKNNDDSFTPELRDADSSKIKFPIDKRGSNLQYEHQVKTQNIFNDLNNNDLRRDRFRKDRQLFFPRENDHQHFSLRDYYQGNYNRRPRYETLENKERESYVNFPH